MVAFKPFGVFFFLLKWWAAGERDEGGIMQITFQFSLVDVGQVVRDWASGALHEDIIGENGGTPA